MTKRSKIVDIKRSKLTWCVAWSRMTHSTVMASARLTQKSGLKPKHFSSTCSSPYFRDRRSTVSMLSSYRTLGYCIASIILSRRYCTFRTTDSRNSFSRPVICCHRSLPME